MMSIAAPAAINTVHSIANTASSLGRSFAHALSGSGQGGSEEVQEQANSTQASPGTFGERLQALAGKLRSWLGDNGMTGPFEINATTGDGGTNVDVSGPEAARIQALVEQSPELKQQLHALAASFQSLMGAMGPSEANIRITELTSEARLV